MADFNFRFIRSSSLSIKYLLCIALTIQEDLYIFLLNLYQMLIDEKNHIVMIKSGRRQREKGDFQ